MKNVLRRLAKRLGWNAAYHVAATYTRDSHVGFSTISMTVTVRPWLHVDNYKELVEYVHGECGERASKPTITSITKLGA